MNESSKSTTYVAVALMVAGFVLIVLAWNGAASRDFIQGQFPYLISGGIAGLGLILGGLALALIQEMRRVTGRLEDKIEWMTEILGSRVEKAGGPTAVPEDGTVVIAGRTSFHRPDCHLVEGRDDMQAMSPGAAADRGLAPCRICTPEAADAAS